MRAYESEARQIPGLPATIVYLPDNPAVTSGLQAKMGDGNAPYVNPAFGYIEGAPSYTVTKRIALHELGHLRDFNNRGQRDAFWTARFGTCTTAPKTWAEANADAHSAGTEIWMVLPGETIAECFAVAIEGTGKERTLDYGCAIDPAAMRKFFGFQPNLPPPTNEPVTLDVRSLLPFVGNIFGTFMPKDSLTFHWNGPPVPEDAEPLSFLRADANYHINQGWGGISYHKAIWRDGTLYITRDPEAVLAACGNALGNARSTHVQVMIGTGQIPTADQWERMTELAGAETTVYPHKFWSGTACPGPEIDAWIGGLEDMSPEQDTRLKNVEQMLTQLQQQQTSLVASSLPTWLQRMFFALNPITGKRQGKELTPPNLEVP